jgi:DNA-binding FrmR family transcriptional regulator
MMDKKLHNRLNRLKGQFNKLHDSIAEGKDCQEVIPQFLAVKGALAGSFEEYVKLSLDSCVETDQCKMKQLIKLLTKN